MSWIKETLKLILACLVTILIIDLVAYQFRDHLGQFLPGYGTSKEELFRGYPLHHFKSDDELGFDINPNVTSSTFMNPKEYKEYSVWGNSYGCFDDEWPKESLKGGVYLAGDSFTWGYASYDKKFGTILEKKLNKKVFACGVSHTGQAHQFKKFIRLFDVGLRPEVVIVNLFSNDLDNDHFFPHTTVINGFMVETHEVCGNVIKDDEFTYKVFQHDQLKEMVEETTNRQTSVKGVVRKYSLTASVIATLKWALLPTNESSESPSNTALSCVRSVYSGISNIGDMYRTSPYTKKHREYIKDWINHAKLNNYRLVFSAIPSKDMENDVSIPFIMEYIEEISGETSRFDDYCDHHCRTSQEVYYVFDEHFSENGNLVYAEYLFDLLN